MKTANQFSIEFGSRLRDRGIKLAVDHANEVITGWIDYAYVHFEKYLSTLPKDAEFMMEDFRDYLKPHLVAPPDPRAFGGISVRAIKNGKITRAGFAPSMNPIAHRRPTAVWRKL